MIESKPIIIECPSCKKRSLPIWRPKSICKNCGKIYKWHELQSKWQKAFITSKNGSGNCSSDTFEICVGCLDNSMLFYRKLGIWVCFSCGNGWNKNEITKCTGCGIYTEFPIDSVCSACWDDGLGISVDLPNSLSLNQYS